MPTTTRPLVRRGFLLAISVAVLVSIGTYAAYAVWQYHRARVEQSFQLHMAQTLRHAHDLVRDGVTPEGPLLGLQEGVEDAQKYARQNSMDDEVVSWADRVIDACDRADDDPP